MPRLRSCQNPHRPEGISLVQKPGGEARVPHVRVRNAQPVGRTHAAERPHRHQHGQPDEDFPELRQGRQGRHAERRGFAHGRVTGLDERGNGHCI